MTLPLVYRGTIVALLVILTHWILWSSVDAKPLYSYADEKGTRIITDDYNKIPPSYRAKVTTVEQETDGYVGDIERVSELVGSAKGFVVRVPGMSLQQSKIITYASMFGLPSAFLIIGRPGQFIDVASRAMPRVLPGAPSMPLPYVLLLIERPVPGRSTM